MNDSHSVEYLVNFWSAVNAASKMVESRNEGGKYRTQDVVDELISRHPQYKEDEDAYDKIDEWLRDLEGYGYVLRTPDGYWKDVK